MKLLLLIKMQMGLVYGCPVEDIVTGLTIQCRGWKSIYYCPNRESFLGVAPNTLEIALVQHRRWSDGMFQIFFSKFCPLIYGHGKLKLGAQLGYCVYLLWAPISFPTLYYVIVPPVCLLRGISLFPQVSPSSSSAIKISFSQFFSSLRCCWFFVVSGLQPMVHTICICICNKKSS